LQRQLGSEFRRYFLKNHKLFCIYTKARKILKKDYKEHGKSDMGVPNEQCYMKQVVVG
jgi:hypothetical protein